MNASRLNLFMKKFTRERVAPIISARVSCESGGTVLTVVSSLREGRMEPAQAVADLSGGAQRPFWHGAAAQPCELRPRDRDLWKGHGHPGSRR
jgi:hypothetical protein